MTGPLKGGRARAVTGGVSETHKYHPFGEQITASFGNQPLKFASMERDPLSTSDYDHARVHSPLLGRFLSPDVLQGYAADPQSWNRYAYVQNNPLLYTDPLGLAQQHFSGDDPDLCKSQPSACQMAPIYSEAEEEEIEELNPAESAQRLERRAAEVIRDLEAKAARAAKDYGPLLLPVGRILKILPKGTPLIQKLLQFQRGKGNFGIGNLTVTQANRLGKAVVGDSVAIVKNGQVIGIRSVDSLRVYRFPALKAHTGRYQANIEEFMVDAGGRKVQIRNAHIDIIE